MKSPVKPALLISVFAGWTSFPAHPEDNSYAGKTVTVVANSA
jgi:hypothetical protein